jgi:hypothetical protein
MMLLVLAVLFTPVCATIAGLIVWAAYRKESLEDTALLRHFLIVLVMVMGLGWATSRTEAARVRLDPQYRMMTEIEANPVFSTIKRHVYGDARPLREFLFAEMSHGATVSQALQQARPMLTRLATDRLGFADQQTHLMWGQFVADSLEELRKADPALCYGTIAGGKVDEQALTQAFSQENTDEFQQAVMKVYESGDREARRERIPTDKPVKFNEAALEFQVVKAEIEQQFGRDVAKQVSSKKFSAEPVAGEGELCAARIFQLQAMLKRPKAMASILIDSILR